MSSPADPEERAVLDFELRVGERTIQAKARLPKGEARLADLLPVLRKFNDAVIGAAVADVEEAGRAVSCCAGCGACCRQVVPISEHEALALVEWIEKLPEAQQEIIRARFAAALAGFEEGMLERVRQAHLIRDRQATQDFALDYLRSRVACPFLVNESCAIHPVRPMKCREYLVTSPAARCVNPTAETISMVDLPATFSKILFHFDRAQNGGGSKWLPLVLLFEWAAQHRHEPQRQDDSVVLFREFMAAFVESTPEELATMLTPSVPGRM